MVVGCAHLVRQLELYFGRKEAYIRKKNRVKISAQSELRISRNIRNGFRLDLGSAETEENREGDPISEGLPPRRHGDHGPEGELSSHLGERPRKKEGGLSRPLSWWRRSAVGARIVTAIYTNNLATVNTKSLPLYAAV